MRVYLAARYSRREELCGYRETLRRFGYDVQARWLDGAHQISDNGIPIGEHGERLVEQRDENPEHAKLRSKFAEDDYEDVVNADLVISFTEPPGEKANRGGRHVEFGIALAKGKQVVVVGHRENIFHWLDAVKFFPTWDDALLDALENERISVVLDKIAAEMRHRKERNAVLDALVADLDAALRRRDTLRFFRYAAQTRH